MYNFMDTWAMAFTNEGKPLVGKIEFCEANTTELKPIFTTDGAELMNPIYCNGITSYQVMLDNGDYTVRYYEYIGNGNMESDFNEASWRLYKTELVSAPKANSTAGTDGVSLTVSTIADLKAVDNMEDGTVVGVVGYYTAEDCPLRYYVWHENGNYSDDGGVVIKSDTTTSGAWVMKIPSSYIDVRWYGDIPSNSSLSTVNTSSLGQRTKAATAANKYDKDLYFPSYGKGTSVGYYMFDGSNTVSVNKDIIVDNAVRFVVKHGTVGTQVTCHELKACERYLFVSELGSSIGGYNITADTIDTSWYASDKAVATGARVKYVIDYLQSPMTFNDTYVELANDVTQSVTFNNCTLEGFKRLSGYVTMSNMMVKTEWFKDDYDYSKLSLYNCQIELENCKDANTYILLKTKQNDPNYGDLGEQTVTGLTLLAGAVAENAMFNGVNIRGRCELHNVSGTVNILGNDLCLNAIDCWLTISSGTVAEALAMRRGTLTGSGLQVLSDVYLEGVIINTPLTTLGADTIIKNCDIDYKITATDIRLLNNNIYAEVDQRDVNGTLTVKCSGNMFHDGAQHYVHATTANTKVVGSWIGNGSTYDDRHWIRLDRTNLLVQDNAHQYTYAGNSEPYLMKYSGRNHPMRFPIYRGDRFEGRGIFATTTIPFVFLNSRTYECFCVPRSVSWKCFSVGRGFLARSGTLRATWDYGIHEDSYTDHTNGYITIIMNWGAQSTSNGAIMDGKAFGYSNMVSRDGDGVANFDVSFESANADHNPETSSGGVFSNGVLIGVLNRAPYDGWSHFALYPATPMQSISLFVHMDPDFQAGSSTPVNF